MNRLPHVLRYPFKDIPKDGELKEVADGIFWIRMPLPMALDHVNCYVLDDGQCWTIVDTGFDTKTTRRLWTDLLAGPLSKQPVGRVIVTHHHPDHIGLAGWFKTAHGAEITTTQTAWLMARMLTLDEQDVPTPETLAFWKHAGMAEETFDDRKSARPFNFSDIVAHLPLGYTRIREGDVISAGGRDWSVHIGNGHAPEHATFWSTQGDVVLGGDQLLPSISPNLGVYATEPGADPVSEWLISCNRFLDLATQSQLVLPGHKLPFIGLPLRLHQLIDNHHGALERLLDHLDSPKNAGECFPALFKRTIDNGVYGLALVEAVAHLNHLYQLNHVTRFLDADGSWKYERAI